MNTVKDACIELSTNNIEKSKFYSIEKRLFDIIMSLIALITLSPFLLIISILIVVEDPKGGPIFKQKRVGKNGKEFTFYKFRSMVVNAEEMLEGLKEMNEMQGPAFKIANDPRITKTGKFIRKTNIDELPQLFNIIKGDMSIVGPRPPLPLEVAKYTEYQMQRISITPGLTCYWQIQPQRNSVSFEEWMKYDLEYIKNRSVLVDLKIIAGTVKSVFCGTGV